MLGELALSTIRAAESIADASGWRIQGRRRLLGLGIAAVGRAARHVTLLMETLALIAYRQPITRGEIEDIRGGGEYEYRQDPDGARMRA